MTETFIPPLSQLTISDQALPPTIPQPVSPMQVHLSMDVPTVVSDVYHQTSQLTQKRSALTNLVPTQRYTRSIQTPQQPTGLIGAVTSIIRSVSSSNQSHLKSPLIMKSRFARTMEVVSHFIRDNWFVIRPIFIGIGVLIGVLVIGPAVLAFLI